MNSISKILIAVISLFVLFRILIPYMISSDSTELVAIACLLVVVVVGIILSRIDAEIFKKLLKNKENRRNGLKHKTGKTSIYKGVCIKSCSPKFCAKISVDNKNIHLGYFLDEKDAAKAYNDAAIKYHKNFAELNIVEE